jgi:hypothetical protein
MPFSCEQTGTYVLCVRYPELPDGCKPKYQFGYILGGHEMVCFQTKNPKFWVNFGEPWNEKSWYTYSMSIRPFGSVVAMWNISPRFGIFFPRFGILDK